MIVKTTLNQAMYDSIPAQCLVANHYQFRGHTVESRSPVWQEHSKDFNSDEGDILLTYTHGPHKGYQCIVEAKSTYHDPRELPFICRGYLPDGSTREIRKSVKGLQKRKLVKVDNIKAFDSKKQTVRAIVYANPGWPEYGMFLIDPEKYRDQFVKAYCHDNRGFKLSYMLHPKPWEVKPLRLAMPYYKDCVLLQKAWEGIFEE